ncbi:motility associated factor glycosyltransferase family protein [Brevibacillus sp. GCM10020057]|uniref:motility associated factor glycosyltransferase family protein n=1 Tax=Brevibacillus sp. GCM10020057 TaxID=3317327 RepID=UPI00362AF4B0
MSYYDSNIQYLVEYNQWLLKHMETVRTDHIESIQVGQDYVYKMVDHQGMEFYSGSIYDPQFEATQFLDKVNFDNTAYVLLGMGSTAIVKQILENKTEASWVLIIEKDTALVKKFLEDVDLSPYLEGKLQRLIILTESVGDMSTVLNTLFVSLIGYYFFQTDLLRTFATFRKDSEYYEEVIQELVNHLRNHMTSMGNSLEDTLLGMENELKNVPVALKSHRLTELKEKYKNKPIICVASGPSLDKQLPLLKSVKGKALIICAESAFRVLLKNGIEPDIVCILERGANSYDLSIKGLKIPKHTALIGLSLMDSRIPEYWNEYVVPVFKENISHSRLMSEALGDMGTLYNGSSVAHLSYSLANYLGGAPIVFIGQDLAYSEEGSTHSKDSFYVDQSGIEMSIEQRNQIKDSLQDDKSFVNREVYLDGYYGGKVRSRELWRQFLFWMEHLITVQPSAFVINATEGGVDIKGTQKMPFKEVVEKYCQEPVETIPEVFSSLPPVPDAGQLREKISNMIDFFNKQLGEFERISSFAEEVLDAANKLQEELEDQEKVELLEEKASRILRNVEQILKDVLSDSFITFFLRPLLSNYHVKINPISRVSSVDRLRQILTHQCYFLKRLIKGKEQVLEVYEKGIEQIVIKLGYDPEEFYLEAKPKIEFPNWLFEEEKG